MKIPKVVIEGLLALGRGEGDCLPDSLRDKRVLGPPYHGWHVWAEIAEQIGVSSLPALIRGLVRYCRASGHRIGGSVSPVIFLYRIVVEQLPAAEPDLTGWVVRHRTNGYEPFGTHNDNDANTYAEHVARQLVRAERTRANEVREAERQKHARENRQQRDRKEATERLASAVRRGDLAAVRALLGKGADVERALPDGGSLVAMALANERFVVAEYLKSLGIV